MNPHKGKRVLKRDILWRRSGDRAILIGHPERASGPANQPKTGNGGKTMWLPHQEQQ